MNPIAYVDDKWPEMWGALIKSSGAVVKSSRDKVDPSHPSIIRGLQYGSMDRLKESTDYWFIDSGYFRAFECHPRSTYRVTRNAFAQNWVEDRPSDRFKKLRVPIKPWTTGRDILICPPYAGWVTELFDEYEWLDRTLKVLNEYTDRPIRVRPKYSKGTIWEGLDGCHALVTFMSNTAVDAAVYGVPVFVPEGNQAAPVGCTDLTQIEHPVYPDREAWANSLAYGQFNLEEFESGLAWEMMNE